MSCFFSVLSRAFFIDFWQDLKYFMNLKFSWQKILIRAELFQLLEDDWRKSGVSHHNSSAPFVVNQELTNPEF